MVDTTTIAAAGVFCTMVIIVTVSIGMKTTGRWAAGIYCTKIVVITVVRWFIEDAFTIDTGINGT
jgi:hypothetical protein